MSADPYDHVGLCTPHAVTTIANLSQPIVGQNMGRNRWTLQAPVEADIYFNPAGGAAGHGLPGNFLLRAGQNVSSRAKNAVAVWCATVGLVISLVEE